MTVEIDSTQEKARRFTRWKILREHKLQIMMTLFGVGLCLFLFSLLGNGNHEESIVRMAAGNEKRAYVALLVTTKTYEPKKYFSALLLWIASLKHYSVADDIIVMATPDVPTTILNSVRDMGAKVNTVTRLESNGTSEWYTPMLTKLTLWTFTEYDQIAYYDADHIFMSNPEQVFQDCGNATFCASHDPYQRDGYFNAGFLVLRPNITVYKEMMLRSDLSNNRGLAEQDMLNEIFENKWKSMGQRHNLMKITRKAVSDSNLVAIHEKWWELRGKHQLTESNWIWNKLIYSITVNITLEMVLAPTFK
eukprot:NODE_824_length_3906_cov_0.315209.p1 type:complete len:306 gc:universal NODE_824_length_3906_cov_0.315209:2001-1084(-)